MNRPLLVAHRGFPLQYPENTIPGIEAALRCGARWVEVDVQLTADGLPVLFHDRTLDRVCGVPGAVHEHTASTLASLRAREADYFGDRFAGVGLARLEDLVALLEAWPRSAAFVEIKAIAVERFGIERVVARVLEVLAGARARCCVVSGVGPALVEARRRGCDRVGLVLDSWAARDAESTRSLRPDLVFINASKVPRGGDLRGDGRLAVYDVIDPGMAMRLFRRGADVVETFAIRDMLAALGGGDDA